jgi:hypothetical protein
MSPPSSRLKSNKPAESGSMLLVWLVLDTEDGVVRSSRLHGFTTKNTMFLILIAVRGTVYDLKRDKVPQWQPSVVMTTNFSSDGVNSC